MNGPAIEPRAKPSAHGRSEVVPAMNRLLTPAGNVRSDGGQPRDGTEHRVSPLNRLFSSPSFRRRLAPMLLLAQSDKESPNAELCVGGPEPSLRGLGESPRAAPRCRDAGGEVRKNRMSIEWCVVRTLQRFGGRGDTSVTFCGFPLTSERRVCILLTQLNSEMNRISGGTVTSDEDSPLRHRVHPGDLRPVAGTDAFRASWCRRGDW